MSKFIGLVTLLHQCASKTRPAHTSRLRDMEKPAFRVLLVDHDEGEYVAITDMLAGTNTSKYDLDWVGTYEDGLKAICQSKYDAILIDYRLGERNGLELLNQVIERDLNVAAILLNGQGEYRIDLEAMSAGASDYLDRQKDFIYLSVNNTFENLTGLKNVVGKKISEVIPGIRNPIRSCLKSVAGCRYQVFRKNWKPL